MVRGKSIGQKMQPLAFLSPALISIFILSFLPIVYTVYIAFTNYNLNHLDDFHFIGLDNFKEIITGDFRNEFTAVFGWNLAFALIVTLGCFSIGLFLAILLNNPDMKETRIYRSLLIIPWALPATIAILSWQGLYNESYGGINGLLKMLHLPSEIPWLSEPFWSRLAIIITTLWLGFSYMMNLSLGILQSIDPALYEAAIVDGANIWQKFRYITLPGITYASIPILITSFSYNFNQFGAAYLITLGGPPRADAQYAGYTDILASTGFKMTTTFFKYDVSAALSIVLFVIIGVITVINMKYTKAFEEVD